MVAEDDVDTNAIDLKLITSLDRLSGIEQREKIV